MATFDMAMGGGWEVGKFIQLCCTACLEHYLATFKMRQDKNLLDQKKNTIL